MYSSLYCSYMHMGEVTKLPLSCYLVLYQLIAKPGNKTAIVLWPDPHVFVVFCNVLVIQCSAAVTLNSSQQVPHILPSQAYHGVPIVSFIWVQIMVQVMPGSLQCCMEYHKILDDVIMHATLSWLNWGLVWLTYPYSSGWCNGTRAIIYLFQVLIHATTVMTQLKSQLLTTKLNINVLVISSAVNNFNSSQHQYLSVKEFLGIVLSP